MQIEERNIHDPVPKNVTKFPIHQTYLTSDAEAISTGGYRFKCPEVWSSARSAKKSIAVRAINWLPISYTLDFNIFIGSAADSLNDEFNFGMSIPTKTPVSDVINTIVNYFNDTFKNETNKYRLKMDLNVKDNTITMSISASGTRQYFRVCSDETHPSESFNIYFNQPKDYFPAASNKLILTDIWDRTTPLQFHASFIPFDNYQYLGTIFDNWNNPVIYQDANASPWFNVWVTTDMKKPIKLLYEQFIFRFTFILDSNAQYRA